MYTELESLEIGFRGQKKDPLLWNRKSLFIVLHLGFNSRIIRIVESFLDIRMLSE